MSLYVFLVVLFAAFLHASWNVIVRLNADRLLSLTILQVFMGCMGLAMLAWFGLPASQSMPFVLASGMLHAGYNLFLVRAYKSADLSQIYPIARGTAPLMTLVGAALLLSEHPGWAAAAGIVVLVAGLLSTGISPSQQKAVDPHALYFAFGTSCFIAAYTLVDGHGARVSHNAFGYAGLLFVLDAVFMLLLNFFMRGPGFATQMRPHWKAGLAGGLASGAAYALVMWAMTVAPIASVAALRETSIVFVLLLSARVLKERLTLRRCAGAILIVIGAVLLRLA